jgi:alpha-mannosidase
VTGSSKQHVAYDYALRLSKGVGDAVQLTNRALEVLVQAPAPFAQCPDANVSVCAASATPPFVVVPYNPLPRPAAPVLRIPLGVAAAVVTDANGTVVPSQVTANAPYDLGALPGRARCPTRARCCVCPPAACADSRVP